MHIMTKEKLLNLIQGISGTRTYLYLANDCISLQKLQQQQLKDLKTNFEMWV